MIDLHLILVRRRYKLGVALIALSTAWFLLCMQLIVPYFNPNNQSAYLGRYGHLGETVPRILINLIRRPGPLWDIIRQPDRFAYLWHIPLPVGYLSLLAPDVMLLALPTTAINVLSKFAPMYALDFVHYSLPLVPFVVIAAISGCGRLLSLSSHLLRHVNRRFMLPLLAAYLLFSSLFYHRVFGHTPLARGFQWPVISRHHRNGHQLLRRVPDGAAVSAQMSLNPHVSQRRRVYVFPQYEMSDYIALDLLALQDNEFSLTPPSSHGQAGSRYYNPALSQADYLELVRELLDDPQWGVWQARDGYLVLRRSESRGKLSRTFYEPFLGCGDIETIPLDVRFGDILDLRGVAVEPSRWTGHVLHTCWEANPPFAKDRRIYLTLVDDSVSPARVIRAQELTISAVAQRSMWLSSCAIHDRVLIHFPFDPQRYALGLMVGRKQAMEKREERLQVSGEIKVSAVLADQAARILVLKPSNREDDDGGRMR